MLKVENLNWSLFYMIEYIIFEETQFEYYGYNIDFFEIRIILYLIILVFYC